MQARLSLHLSKCHIVGNHIPPLTYPEETNDEIYEISIFIYFLTLCLR